MRHTLGDVIDAERLLSFRDAVRCPRPAGRQLVPRAPPPRRAVRACREPNRPVCYGPARSGSDTRHQSSGRDGGGDAPPFLLRTPPQGQPS